MFRRWVPISFIAVAISLALAGGAVLAAGAGDGGVDERRSNVFERAAQILGIGPSQLEDAHDQATRELRDEKLAAVIDKLVANGLIDQSEADSFTAWMADRPAIADEALFAAAFNFRSPGMSQLGLPRLGLSPGGDVIARIAEILGLDEQELIDALESGASEVASASRLAAMHAVIDSLVESGTLTPDEATELRGWADEIPRWLLDIDLGSRILPALGLGQGGHAGPGDRLPFKFRLPFGREGFERHEREFFFRDGEGEFNFEFRLPEGTFRFGPGRFGPDGVRPGEHQFPFGRDLFSDERLQEFLDRFDFDGFDFERFGGIEGLEGLGGLDNLEDLFERFRGFRGHGLPVPPTDDPDGTGDDSDPTSSSFGASA